MGISSVFRRSVNFASRAIEDGRLEKSLRKFSLRAAPIIKKSFKPETNVYAFYDNILGTEQGIGLKLTLENVSKGSMTWVIPDFTKSSGGHINIFRMMKYLSERGFSPQHVVILEPHRWNSATEARAALINAFGDFGYTVSLGSSTLEPCHYIFATSWKTAYWVAKYKDALHKCYFVQDFEPYFYSHGTAYIIAENTYRLGLTGITAGTWISEKLERDYGMITFPYSFSYEADIYWPREKRPNPNRCILFYARPVTPRRCFELGLLALKKVCDEVPDAAVIFAGWDVGGYKIPFNHLNAGVIDIEKLSDLYSQCEVALILSGTNLSLLPMEVAACGCPIVINRGGNTEWLFDETEATYCDLSVEDIEKTLINVLEDDRPGARRRAKRAKEKASKSSWAKEADAIAEYLYSMDTIK